MLQPEDVLKRIVWRQTLALSSSVERFITWSVAGVAAFTGLLISNLDSVAEIIERTGLKWGISLLAASILAGAICKQIALAVGDGVARIAELENFLMSQAGQQLMNEMTTDPSRLAAEMAEPYLWPISFFVRKGAERGAGDALAGDKRFVFLFSHQLWAFWWHVIFAVASIIVIAASIVPAGGAAEPQAAAVATTGESWFATFQLVAVLPRGLNIAGLGLTFAGAALLFFYAYPFKKLSRDVFVVGQTVTIAEPPAGQTEETQDWWALARPFMRRAKWLNRIGFALVSIGTLMQLAAQYVSG